MKRVIQINIGVDIGGNHIGIGIIDEKNNIVKKEITDYINHEVTASQILNVLNDFLKNNDISGVNFIGIGIPGVATNTFINYTCNMPLSNVEIRDYVHTELPIKVSNDANCAALAEYTLGNYEDVKNFALVTVGTGIGGGIVINKKLYTGSSNSAAELGHMIIEKEGLKCNCGRRGCFEQYASVTALKRLTNLDTLEEIFYLLDKKNPVILDVFDKYLESLSEGLANLANILDLDMLVIGGSISEYRDKFLPLLEEKIRAKLYNKINSKFRLETAKFNNDAGIIGASLLEKEEI